MRSQLTTTAATMTLVGHMKVGALLGTTGAPTVLERAAVVARNVPVYTLKVVRNIERLDEVVEAIFAWHQVVALSRV